MRIIKLDAANWKTVIDFYDALLAAIGAPKWHGKSPDGLIDSMIWGGINAVEPPYTIRISGTKMLPRDVREHIELVKHALAEARLEYQSRKGGDIEVSMETAA
jgi:Barstar (barnase inhibitor)